MRIFRFDEIDSTNSYLKGVKDLKNYDMAIAKTQSAGRGRRGNHWKSEEGAALFSFALKEEKYLSIDEYIKLPLIVGISVLKALEDMSGQEHMFKWTNDVYLNNKKVSGILVEKIEGFFIIGIGINVNNMEFDEISNKATSLRKESGRDYDISDIVSRVVMEFKKEYSDFLTGGWLEILHRINKKNYLYGREITIDLRSREERGVAYEINQDGTLQVEIGGVVKDYSVGEIHISFKRWELWKGRL